MAITLNKHAVKCVKVELANGNITSASSPRTSIYDISRHWRVLVDATSMPSRNLKSWSEREEAAMEVMLSALTYLQRIGCTDSDQLMKDTLSRHIQGGKVL